MFVSGAIECWQGFFKGWFRVYSGVSLWLVWWFFGLVQDLIQGYFGVCFRIFEVGLGSLKDWFRGILWGVFKFV